MSDDDAYKIVEIGNKQYLPVDILVSDTIKAKKREELLKKFGGFVQRIKEIKPRFLGPTYAVLVCLVPLENLIEFCNTDI